MSMPLLPIATLPASVSTASTYTDSHGLAELKKDPSSPQAMSAVAQQVEALFLQMVLKSMRDASAATSESASNEMGMYQDMFDKQVALTLSQHQDLGFGALLKRQLSGKSAPTLAPVTPKTGAATTAPTAALAHSPKQFVNQVLPLIRRAAATLGVNPDGLLAQAALETGWGQRMPRTADGAPSLNLFGIKAGAEWSGTRAVADTVEFRGGVATQRRTAFRAYASIEESVSDFANLLKNSPRYHEALAAGSDTQAYIKSMGKSGYATDPEYANKLNEILNSDAIQSTLSARTAAL